MFTRRAALVFGVGNVLTAALVLFGVFGALPARWWPVDTGAVVMGGLQLASGVGLLRGTSWGPRAAKFAAAVALALGLLFVSVLAVTASWLSGVYGPVGRGAAIVFALVVVLALPYVVVLPLVQLAWFRGARVAETAGHEAGR